MKARAIATLSVLALTAAFAPLIGLAASAPAMSYDLNTREYDPISAGEYDGRLRLSISADGIVYGSFMNTEGRLSEVTGGMKGRENLAPDRQQRPDPEPLLQRHARGRQARGHRARQRTPHLDPRGQTGQALTRARCRAGRPSACRVAGRQCRASAGADRSRACPPQHLEMYGGGTRAADPAGYGWSLHRSGVFHGPPHCPKRGRMNPERLEGRPAEQ